MHVSTRSIDGLEPTYNIPGVVRERRWLEVRVSEDVRHTREVYASPLLKESSHDDDEGCHFRAGEGRAKSRSFPKFQGTEEVIPSFIHSLYPFPVNNFIDHRISELDSSRKRCPSST